MSDRRLSEVIRIMDDKITLLLKFIFFWHAFLVMIITVVFINCSNSKSNSAVGYIGLGFFALFSMLGVNCRYSIRIEEKTKKY